MSWQAISFVILIGSLLAGIAWYERSRPPSQVVALVGALAALAVAGRVAFGAFPNVKPTTDIIIFAGFALGAAPGFAVGALTALISNFWFGQGPWTPWQMAAWGLCGVFGAGLALGGRNIGRLTLAAACGFAGVAYGALLNFSLLATYGGNLTIQSFLVLESRAVPFDAAHALGNIAFALIAGPAMIRMLVRFRRRFEWRLPAAATTMLLALGLLAIVPALAGADAGQGAGWLVSAQNTDGGFGESAGSSSSAAMTGWAMLGLEAAGRNPLDVSRGGRTPVDYLRSHLDALKSAGDLARTILALEGAGVDARSFGGRNLVSALAKREAGDGSFEGFPATTAYSVIALRVGGAPGGLGNSESWLVSAQDKDGGWGDLPNDSASTADDTGAVMQAISGTKAARQGGLDYLRKAQRGNGGFPLGGGGKVNSQSTAWAVQGMLAVGADPSSIKSGGNSGLDYLSSMQQSDGHYRYSSESDQTPVWVTGQALVAVSGEFFPVSVPARAPTPTPQTSKPTSVSPVPAQNPVTGHAGSPTLTEPGSANPAGQTGGTGAAGAAPSTHAGPLVPPPVSASPLPTEPESTGSAAAPVPGAPAASAGGASGPSPWIPVGIGLAGFGLALGIPLALGRRFAW